MANLPELEQFDAGIYQIETSDPVLGGPEGTTNLPLKNLANRTKWLKKHVDDLESGSTVPTNVATKTYVADEINKLDGKQSVRAATTANIALAGTQVIDGVNLVSGDRVLVKNQNTASENGLYLVQGSGWIRTTDADASAEVTPGLVVAVEEGTLQGDTIWKLTTNAPIVLGTTGLTFTDVTAGYAPIASPAFTGTPTAPTPAQFDETGKLATMEALQRAIGNFRSISTINVNTVLTAADAGKLIIPFGTSPIAITLPLANTCKSGVALHFENVSNQLVTINRQGANFIQVGASAALTSVTLAPGETLTLSTETNGWYATGGSGTLPYESKFAASITASGYQKLPSGLILQWGLAVASVPAGGSLVVTLPIAFPAGVLGAIPVSGMAGPVDAVLGIELMSLSQFRIRNGGSSATTDTSYFCYGY